jgi:hypothetical protein
VLDFRELLFPAPMLLQKYFYGKKTIFNYSPEIYLQQKKNIIIVFCLEVYFIHMSGV